MLPNTMSAATIVENPLRVGLTTDVPPDRGTLVIFGASGDLTGRKLLPAVYNLARERALPSVFALVGFGRREFDDETFRAKLGEEVRRHSRQKPVDEEVWREVAAGMRYVRGDYDDPESYTRLAETLAALDRENGGFATRTYYLAVPPRTVSAVVRRLREAGLCDAPAGAPTELCGRVLVEKPFGTDLASAVALNRELQSVLQERQIFRIDHYLGKETVQNILVLRFGNTIFEPLWNRNHVEYVELTAAEDIGIESRGRFYEQTGLFRDIIQNHALQLLSLVAMEAPVAWDADAVRDEKVKALRAIRPLVGKLAVERNTVRGQYGAGVVRGEAVPGYREEPDVSGQSNVETFGALRIHVDNWRWANVPFYLRAGKRLAQRATEIVLHFKPLPHTLLSSSIGPLTRPNALVLRIQPDEGVALDFATKVPGQSLLLREVAMDFRYGAAFGLGAPEAYERLLLDAMRGDATLFTRADEAEAQWRYVDPILRGWLAGEVPLTSYQAGSWGPTEALALPERDGFSWSTP
jgi:glucose-6-phosphate 1-dehydrogenase